MDSPQSTNPATLGDLFNVYTRLVRSQRSIQNLLPKVEQARRLLDATGGGNAMSRARYTRLKMRCAEAAAERRAAIEHSRRWLALPDAQGCSAA